VHVPYCHLWPVAYSGIFSCWGGGGGERVYFEDFFLGEGRFNKFSCGQGAERMVVWGGSPPCQGFHTICKWMKRRFCLGWYGCIFHGTGSSAQRPQNFWISGGGGGVVWTSKPLPSSVRHCLWPTWRYKVFLYYKRRSFLKSITEHKMFTSSFSTTCIWKIFHSKKYWAKYDKKLVFVFM
jgi:hypothetical protein